MNKEIQESLEQQSDETQEAEVAEVAKRAPLKFSAEMIARDKRKVDIVEVNLKDATARVVESSEAPKLTEEVLEEKGAPLQVGKAVFDGADIAVDMWHGVPLVLEIGRSRILDIYKERDTHDITVFTEREVAVKRYLLAGMIPETFSFEGKPAGLPAIEECSDILLSALWDAYMDLHFPIEDDIYQVQVMRGVPFDVNQMLGKTFEMYPVGGKVNTDGMPDDEVEAFVERSDAQRAVLVASMILDPKLSLADEERKMLILLKNFLKGLCSAFSKLIDRVTFLLGVGRHYSDFYDNSLTEPGKIAIIEVSAIAEKYGQRPSDLIKGDPFDLQLDLIHARTHWKHDHEQRERNKQKKSSRGWGGR